MCTPRPKIILADDFLEMRERLKRMLENDYDVIASVGDGQSLVDAVQEHGADLLVIDIAMPIMSGLNALRHIRKAGDTTPAIILTSFGDSDVAEEAFRIGAKGFVLKEHIATDLVPAVETVLGGSPFVCRDLESQ